MKHNMFLVIIADILDVNKNELKAFLQAPDSFEFDDWYERITVNPPYSKPGKEVIETRKDEFQIPFNNRKIIENVGRKDLELALDDEDWGARSESLDDDFIAKLVTVVSGRESSISKKAALYEKQQKYVKRAKKKDEFFALVAAYNEERVMDYGQLMAFSAKTNLVFDLISKLSFYSALQIVKDIEADEVTPQDLKDLMIDNLEVYLLRES